MKILNSNHKSLILFFSRPFVGKNRKVWLSLFFLIFIVLVFFLTQGAKDINNFYSLNGNLFQSISSKFDSSNSKEVLVIFNSGGWGNTPIEKAKDFRPVVKGIQDTLNQWGYSSVVVSYNRTRNSLLGKVEESKEILGSFEFQSSELADQIEYFLRKNPKSKVIMAGLCMGGSFVNETMKKISHRSRVYAIEAGVPFWIKRMQSENVLGLNNNDKDSLATGQLRALVISLLEAPERWILAKIRGESIPFSHAIQAPGHEYDWSSPEVGPKVVSFLESKLKPSQDKK